MPLLRFVPCPHCAASLNTIGLSGLNCDKERVKEKDKWMSYKSYVSHCLVEHGLVETWLGRQTDDADLLTVHKQLAAARLESGQVLQDPPARPPMQQIHCCLLCGGKKDGKDDKEAKELSLVPEQSFHQNTHYYHLKYHYAMCLAERDLTQFLSHFHPDPQHQADPDDPESEVDPAQLPAQLGYTWAGWTWLDSQGQKLTYECSYPGCNATTRRRLGFKEYVGHSSGEFRFRLS